MKRTVAGRLSAIIAFPTLIIAVLACASIWSDRLWLLFRSAESVRSWVEGRGAAAPLAFVALQVLQVVVFIIPGEVVQIAGGYAFGFGGGILWSSVGILLGSLVNYAIGRLAGRPFVTSLIGSDRMARIDSATVGGRAITGFFLLYVIPGLPKDALTYLAGAGKLPFVSFVCVSTLGRLPGIIGSAWMGSAAWERDYVSAMAVSGVAAFLFFVGLFLRKRLFAVIGRLARRSGRPLK